MTSPSPSSSPMASAQPLSETRHNETREAVAADALSQLQTRQSGDDRETRNAAPATSPVEITPLSSISTSSQGSFGYGSLSLSGSGSSPTFPPQPARREIPSRSSKRTAPSSDLRSIKSRRGSQDSHYPFETPTTSTGAQVTPAAYPVIPSQSSSRAPGPGPVTPTFFQEPPPVKRGRARKATNRPSDFRFYTGARVGDSEDVRTSTPSAPPRFYTGARVGDSEDGRTSTPSAPPQRPGLLDLQAPLPPFSPFGARTPSEVLSAGPASSLGYRGHAGSSVSGGQNSVPPTPSMPAREYINTPSSSGPLSEMSHFPMSMTRETFALMHASAGKSTSLNKTFGLPPYPPPSATDLQKLHQNLPPLQSVLQEAAVQPSVDADGFMIIRRAVPVEQVREIVAMIANGLKVVTRSETTQTYGMPLQAYRLRDDFVNKWRESLRPFYDPLGKRIPKMPLQTELCAFRANDPSNVNRNLLNIGGRNWLLVHIALTALSSENGFFNIFRGSHQSKHPTTAQFSEWSPAHVTLAEGDAIVWRGDLSYLRSSSGGGVWLNLNFDWGPNMVDLTTEEESSVAS